MKWIGSTALILGVSLTQLAAGANVFVDFGESSQLTAGNFNNIVVNSPATLSIADMVDEGGANTGVGISISGFFPGSNSTGQTAPAGDAAALFPVTATRDNAFGHTGPFSGNPDASLGTVSLTGLNPALTYDFTFFASRTGVSDNRETAYDISGANSGVGYLNASANVDTVVTVAGIQPTGSGAVSIDVSAGPNNDNGSRFYYLGAMMITTAIPEPTSALLAMTAVGFVLARRRRA
ncbi:PEP-CTERM sorting domain-containing protein [Botrimarina mediterranea]|uniref:PEP-CTERM protein-sorting domain-containing protein n=1 Tax=Botrimarina mediterranea TaxID=2528022 RepID=A0A518K2H8_9BACT|nr:PEP-CTERM sorting domain-containing protein [Botrimarina mediterranea]QDV72004.1 hypothetical protein Spa11_01740 [Botrimarina mediterranea]QDV76545.1 hypothetical protein K2D_01240 [Planctomycetes bacterium K2D]